MRSAAEMDAHPLMRPVDIGVPLPMPERRDLPGTAAGLTAIGASMLAGLLLIRRKGASS